MTSLSALKARFPQGDEFLLKFVSSNTALTDPKAPSTTTFKLDSIVERTLSYQLNVTSDVEAHQETIAIQLQEKQSAKITQFQAADYPKELLEHAVLVAHLWETTQNQPHGLTAEVPDSAKKHLINLGFQETSPAKDLNLPDDISATSIPKELQKSEFFHKDSFRILNPVQYIQPKANTLYQMELPEDKFEEIRASLPSLIKDSANHASTPEPIQIPPAATEETKPQQQPVSSLTIPVSETESMPLTPTAVEKKQEPVKKVSLLSFSLSLVGGFLKGMWITMQTVWIGIKFVYDSIAKLFTKDKEEEGTELQPMAAYREGSLSTIEKTGTTEKNE